MSHIKDISLILKETIVIRNELKENIEDMGYKTLPVNGNFITVCFDSLRDCRKAILFLNKNGVLVSPIWSWEFTSKKEPFFRMGIPVKSDIPHVTFTLKILEYLMLIVVMKHY